MFWYILTFTLNIFTTKWQLLAFGSYHLVHLISDTGGSYHVYRLHTSARDLWNPSNMLTRSILSRECCLCKSCVDSFITRITLESTWGRCCMYTTAITLKHLCLTSTLKHSYLTSSRFMGSSACTKVWLQYSLFATQGSADSERIQHNKNSSSLLHCHQVWIYIHMHKSKNVKSQTRLLSKV